MISKDTNPANRISNTACHKSEWTSSTKNQGIYPFDKDITTISSNQHKSEQPDYILHKQRHKAKQTTETHTAAIEKSLPARVQQETNPITQIDKDYQQDRATPRVTGTDWYQCTKAPKTDCKASTNQTSTTQFVISTPKFRN
jgi:hypothetical protein